MRWAWLALVSSLSACGGNVNTPTASGGATSSSHVGGKANTLDTNGGTGGVGANSTNATAGTSVGQGGSSSSVFCNLDAPPSNYTTPAIGAISGPNIAVTLGTGSANAYLEHTPGSYAVAAGLWVSITGTTPANSETSTSFVLPADATRGSLSAFVNISAAVPGTYESTIISRCSFVSYCVYLPIPASVNCANVTDSQCPEGCSLQGPVSAPSCQPDIPERCYFAEGAMTCTGETPTPQGSWSLTLTSVTPCSDNPSPSVDITYYVVHGTLTASLAGDSADAPDTATLMVTF